MTLGEMRAKGMTILEVACHRCERRDRLRIERLIIEHGRDGYGPCDPRISRAQRFASLAEASESIFAGTRVSHARHYPTSPRGASSYFSYMTWTPFQSAGGLLASM